MSLVVFPFKEESPDLLGKNISAAAAHPAVDEVWAVASSESDVTSAVLEVVEAASVSVGTPVDVFPQERLGTCRPGKGDGMNTAIALAADRGFDRVHFYDADITNFDARWIEGAEAAADRGYEVVRHRYPRAATDAMITWMVTRPALAMLFPGSLIPQLGQPLGGEMLLTSKVVGALAEDPFVAARSDWGIDTVLSHATSVLGVPMYEHNLQEGKRHSLYGSLAELRDMVVECLDAARSLRSRARPAPGSVLEKDLPAPAPADLKEIVAYDFDATVALLVEGWTAEETSLAELLPDGIGDLLLQSKSAPNFSFMNADRWGVVLGHLLDVFVLGEPAWEALAFRLWLSRVLAYTTGPALAGYDDAMDYLEATIREYEKNADHHVVR